LRRRLAELDRKLAAERNMQRVVESIFHRPQI
jgi:hypothetical protein